MESIAIIGIGCRFPGAESPQAFWQLLRDGVDAVTEAPATRRYSASDSRAEALMAEHGAKRWGGFIKQPEMFDPAFFKISPREAARIDPQQRLLLEVAWEALEDAGQSVEQLAETMTGVFMGVMNEEYAHVQLSKLALIDAHLGVGSSSAVAANRISYTFDLRGPSMVVNTLCSSSLVAVHLACQSLRSGESAPVALVGGVNIMLRPAMDIFYAKSGLLAADGRCKTFDARADGLVRGEGAGVVVLKLLSQALADGDDIYAVIRGSAVNQDGRSNGITAPSRWGQISVMTEAYRQAGISPGSVQYVEAHGTGTPLADSIEATALATVLGSERPADLLCRIGSVKTNLGHLESASGIASLIKVALMLDHHELTPTIHFQQPHPYIAFKQLRLCVQQTFEPWPDAASPARAGVNSFGLVGTNAHIVLEESPGIRLEQRRATEIGASVEESEARLLPLSAHNQLALQCLAASYSTHLKDNPAQSLADICHTASLRRSHHDFRLALVARTREECGESLQAFARGDKSAQVFNGRRMAARRNTLAFVFADYEDCWRMWLRELYAGEKLFRAVVEQCDVLLRDLTGKNLLPEWLDPKAHARRERSELELAGYFAFQVALASLWCSWGAEPEAVAGDGAGEIAAAHLAGSLSLKDGLRVILRHAARWREFTGAAVAANLAADNVAPCVLKPRTDFEAESLLKDIDVHPATLPAISLHTGKEIVKLADTGTQMRNVESEMSGLEALVSKRQVTFLQMGAQSTDAKMLAQCLREYHRDEAVLASLDYDSPARETMLKAASVLYTQGRGLEWGNIAHESSGKLVRLPLYPFQRERYWLDEEGETDLASAQSGQARAGTHTHPLPGRHSQFAHFPGHHFWELELDPQGLEKLLRAQPADGENPHAAIFAEMARAAASEVFGMRMWLVQEVELKSVLPVRAGETRMIQTTLISGQSGEATFHIHSCRAEPQDSWLWHVTGKLRAVERQTDADGIDHSQGLEARLAATRPTREVILAAADADERRRLLEVFLREQIARSLDAAPSRLDIELPLSYLGLDSLLAVEIKQNIESSLGATLPLALLLQDANIVQLADELAQRLSSATNAPAASTSAPGDDETASLMAKLDELSDDEVERLLGQMMTEEEITE